MGQREKPRRWVDEGNEQMGLREGWVAKMGEIEMGQMQQTWG